MFGVIYKAMYFFIFPRHNAEHINAWGNHHTAYKPSQDTEPQITSRFIQDTAGQIIDSCPNNEANDKTQGNEETMLTVKDIFAFLPRVLNHCLYFPLESVDRLNILTICA